MHAFLGGQGQDVNQTPNVANQWQTAMLEDITGTAALRTADQLAAISGNFIGTGHLKASCRDIRAGAYIARSLVSAQSYPLQTGKQSIAQAQIGIHQGTG